MEELEKGKMDKKEGCLESGWEELRRWLLIGLRWVRGGGGDN